MPPKKSLIKITVQVNEDKISIISGSAENTHLSTSEVLFSGLPYSKPTPPLFYLV